MKVQYKLVDVKTNNVIVSIGNEFEIVDFIKGIYENSNNISWGEAIVLFGNGGFTSTGTPIGVLKCKTLTKGG